MTAITDAVTLGRTGDRDAARATLIALWPAVHRGGDPLHRCVLAHHLADLCDDPAEALGWNIRALDATDLLDDERTERAHPGLRVRGFYSSVHLNLAEDYRRLGSFDLAKRHLGRASEFLDAVPDDEYGTVVRQGIAGVTEAVDARSAAAREMPEQ
ncbi:hypothetical protein GCM10009754_23720 [Amycolatopsis minnesotensis]|uniref:Tetratricopeptide repeat protein n=2 Tax=Amycolatopsis minnesotensis TaxID=337894 RepID=A0ABP5BW52_9PSEU